MTDLSSGLGTAASGGDARELRLALVCYGGSSLAIYMHGITKEIHRLVKASALLEAGQVAEASGSELVYCRLLSALAEGDAPCTRVVVDVIAGTSAGGINGIYLAKSLAHNLSQDQLRELWFERGNIDGLLNAPRLPRLRLPGVVQRPLSRIRLPGGLSPGRASRLMYVGFRARKHTPLRGDGMGRWLYEALNGMDAHGAHPNRITSLMPDGHLLELFVTITDFYGYDRQVAITDPPFIHELRHRHALRFSYRSGADNDDFGAASNGALAFAARTTSCFPGVFPPVSFEVFRSYLGAGAIDLNSLRSRYFRLYELAGANPAETFFVDGGVLDNKPFRLAIEAMRKRPAALEVDRRLLYLEPAPGAAPKAEPHSAPGTVGAALGSLAGLPSQQPILDDLVEIAEMNERVRRIQDIVLVNFEHVRQVVLWAIENTGGDKNLDRLPEDASDPVISEWMSRIRQRTAAESRLTYTTYFRMRVSSTVDGLGLAACAICNFTADSNQALLVRSVMRHWAKSYGADEDGLFARAPEPTDLQRRFVRAFDLGFRRRRLLFLIDGLSAWYPNAGKDGYPRRADLDEGKSMLYEAVDRLEQTMAGQIGEGTLSSGIKAVFDVAEIDQLLKREVLDAAQYAADHKARLDELVGDAQTHVDQTFNELELDLYAKLHILTKAWSSDLRRDLFVRYLGFPVWDVLLYPIQSLAYVGEQDTVKVVRLSPLDSRLLTPPDEPKVKGVALHHFGAFFDRSARENDYLWGRLDAAERLVTMLLGGDQIAQKTAWCKQAFEAILAEDTPALRNVKPLTDHLSTAVGQL